MELVETMEHLKLIENNADKGNQPEIKNFQILLILHSGSVGRRFESSLAYQIKQGVSNYSLAPWIKTFYYCPTIAPS